MAALDDDTYLDEEAEPARARRLRYSPTRVREAEAFRKAERHSTLVGRLKYILPAIAVAGVLVFWASARFIPGDMESLVKVSGIDAKTNTVVMQKPQISGFEGTRRAYEVKADSAVQSLSDPRVVTFDKITGKLGLDDAGTANLTAPKAIYNGNDNTLSLDDGLDITTTTGYAARMTSAKIDLAAGGMTSDQPLQLRSKEGTLTANAVEVIDRGKRVRFTGGVSITYMPSGELVTATGMTGTSATATP
jgi:lipopolysaccharide export system protein LptC